MTHSAALVLALLVSVVVARTEQDSSKNRPVTKVINLLKDMISQLEKEGEEDEEVYEVMGCWCKTGDEEKTKAIASGESRINELSSAIEELTGKSSLLNTEIANLNKEVAKNEEALESATALRNKQLAEFTQEEKDMLTSVTSLKGAVIALSKHHESAFLQRSVSERDLSSVAVVAEVEHQLSHHSALLAEVITPHQRRALKAFVAAPESYIGGQTALLQQAQPQSGEIFGILKAMKESFETNLAQSQKEEAENNNAYLDLKAAKEGEISAGRSLAEKKTEELATTDEKNAQSKQDLEDTRNTLAADTEYLANLKERCQNVDHEYEERVATRQLEIQATSKALAFLSSDEAHDTFTRTFNPALLQRRSSESRQRAAVVAILAAAARKSSDPRLSLLAAKSKLNPAFEEVKKTIQTMVDALEQEKQDEIKLRDFCIEEMNSNEKATTSKTRDKADIEATINDLKLAIDGLIKEIEDLHLAMKEAQVQLARAGQNREKENREFQVTIQDQRATKKLLTAALGVLKGFYDKAALLQSKSGVALGASPPPPPGFKSYEKNASSGGVMGMMQSIIDDATSLEEEATRGEEDAQRSYETFVKDTNAAVDEMTKSLTNKSEAKARAESDLTNSEKELEETMSQLDVLAAADADLHNQCDYTLKNFDMRQSARDDEVEALKQAIAMFSGASFGAFFQHRA